MTKIEKDWFQRLIELIKNDGRTMIEISKAAGCGQNYIQQMVNGGKRPSVDKLMAILNALGNASAIYVITGFNISEEDIKFITWASSGDKKKLEALNVLLTEQHE
ncbi:helix-turn-helix transcriptional regulator [Bartonella sp. WD12.1]|uniref:helix-turn-helix domain-containing protein n=1 Tax=Bartonella sp. WD12.1 TaxID=1933903 RepID=UPI00099ABA61|nr:helix-turn-helix transcriptional regulator [Bartonella sp. WD12.1]OPB29462.1 helix-turn-helix protein [Bartonella sp. WD12.1]